MMRLVVLWAMNFCPVLNIGNYWTPVLKTGYSQGVWVYLDPHGQ